MQWRDSSPEDGLIRDGGVVLLGRIGHFGAL
jgi:hypothetical protein